MGNKSDRLFNDSSFEANELIDSSTDQLSPSLANCCHLNDSFSNLFDKISTLSQTCYLNQSQDDPAATTRDFALSEKLADCSSSSAHFELIEISSKCEEKYNSNVEILSETPSSKVPGTSDPPFDVSDAFVDAGYDKPDLYFCRLTQKNCKNLEKNCTFADCSWDECVEVYVKWLAEPWKWCIYSCRSEQKKGMCDCAVCKFWSQVNSIRRKYCSEDFCKLTQDSHKYDEEFSPDTNNISQDQLEQIEEDHEVGENEECQLFDDEGPRIRYVCRREPPVNQSCKSRKFKIILSALPKSIKRDLKRKRKVARAELRKHIFDSIDDSYVKPEFDLVADSSACVVTSNQAVVRPRHNKKRCGVCLGCLSKNCGQCSNCLDMKVFGGLGMRKATCISRRCEYILGTR